MNFHPIDWIIVIVYLAATMAAGLYGKRYVLGLGDFLVAGRKLGTYIGVATLAATEIGTITFMYYAATRLQDRIRVVRQRLDRRPCDDLHRAHRISRKENARHGHHDRAGIL